MRSKILLCGRPAGSTTCLEQDVTPLEIAFLSCKFIYGCLLMTVHKSLICWSIEDRSASCLSPQSPYPEASEHCLAISHWDSWVPAYLYEMVKSRPAQAILLVTSLFCRLCPC